MKFFSLNVKNQNPKHGLTTEEMMPFIQAVIESQPNWTILSSALLIRSRLEVEHMRKAERAALQIQVS